MCVPTLVELVDSPNLDSRKLQFSNCVCCKCCWNGWLATLQWRFSILFSIFLTYLMHPVVEWLNWQSSQKLFLAEQVAIQEEEGGGHLKTSAVIGRCSSDTHLSTTCQPLVNHLSTICQPLVNQLSTTCQPLVNHLPTTCQPLFNHFSTTFQPLFNHLSTTYQPIINHLST